jgi:hypothetical protein
MNANHLDCTSPHQHYLDCKKERGFVACEHLFKIYYHCVQKKLERQELAPLPKKLGKDV